MSTWLPGPAAHADLWAAAPEAERLDAEQAEPILAALGSSGTVERLSLRNAFPEGYYKFTAADRHAFFLKIVANEKLDRCRRADVLAQWVAKAGIQTSLISDEFPKALGQDFQILGYDFIPGRYGSATAEDIDRLGSALAQLHNAMRDFPRSDAAQNDSRSRANLVLKWRERAGQGRLPGPHAPLAAAILAQGGHLRSAGNPQLIHGDLNRGNILFREDGQVVVLDYETALSSWGDPALDFVVALQRFILVPVEKEAEVRLLGRVLFEAYGKAGGRHSLGSGEDVLADLDWVAARNVALLCESTEQGRDVSDREWEKQLWLGELTARRRNALLSLAAAGSTAVSMGQAG